MMTGIAMGLILWWLACGRCPWSERNLLLKFAGGASWAVIFVCNSLEAGKALSDIYRQTGKLQVTPKPKLRITDPEPHRFAFNFSSGSGSALIFASLKLTQRCLFRRKRQLAISDQNCLCYVSKFNFIHDYLFIAHFSFKYPDWL